MWAYSAGCADQLRWTDGWLARTATSQHYQSWLRVMRHCQVAPLKLKRESVSRRTLGWRHIYWPPLVSLAIVAAIKKNETLSGCTKLLDATWKGLISHVQTPKCRSMKRRGNGHHCKFYRLRGLLLCFLGITVNRKMRAYGWPLWKITLVRSGGLCEYWTTCLEPLGDELHHASGPAPPVLPSYSRKFTYWLKYCSRVGVGNKKYPTTVL